MQGAGEAPRDIQITTSPEGGTLTLNSRELGPAPYSGKLFPGTYAVGAALEGYEPATQEVTVGAGGEPIVVKVELTKIPDPDKPDPDPDPTPDPQTPDLIDGPVGRPFRTAKWVGVGVTGAALVAAGVSLFFDGRGTCDLNPPQEECPEVYDTQNVTIGAGIGALVVGGLSIWMFLRDGSDARRQAAWEEQERERAKKKAEPAVSLTPGGAIGGVRFRF
jgi:hypothetical protein